MAAPAEVRSRRRDAPGRGDVESATYGMSDATASAKRLTDPDTPKLRPRAMGGDAPGRPYLLA